jgi:hypothetical protein
MWLYGAGELATWIPDLKMFYSHTEHNSRFIDKVIRTLLNWLNLDGFFLYIILRESSTRPFL